MTTASTHADELEIPGVERKDRPPALDLRAEMTTNTMVLMIHAAGRRPLLTWILGAVIRLSFSGSGGEAVAEGASAPPGDFGVAVLVAGVE